MCLCASGILGTRLRVRGPPGMGGGTRSRLEVAPRLVHRADGGLRLLRLCKYAARGITFLKKIGNRWSPNGTFCVTQWLPESARFNLLAGKTEKAMATLAHIAKENGKPVPRGKLIAHKRVR